MTIHRYINPTTGNDENDGSQESPWASFANAYPVNLGDADDAVVHLADGEYERFTWPPEANYTHSFQYLADTEHGAIINGLLFEAANKYTVNVTFDGVEVYTEPSEIPEINGFWPTQTLLALTKLANISFENCRFEGYDRYRITSGNVTLCDDILFERCEFTEMFSVLEFITCNRLTPREIHAHNLGSGSLLRFGSSAALGMLTDTVVERVHIENVWHDGRRRPISAISKEAESDIVLEVAGHGLQTGDEIVVYDIHGSEYSYSGSEKDYVLAGERTVRDGVLYETARRSLSVVPGVYSYEWEPTPYALNVFVKHTHPTAGYVGYWQALEATTAEDEPGVSSKWRLYWKEIPEEDYVKGWQLEGQFFTVTVSDENTFSLDDSDSFDIKLTGAIRGYITKELTLPYNILATSKWHNGSCFAIRTGDIVIRKCVVHNVYNNLGQVVYTYGVSGQTPRYRNDILFENNLFYDINATTLMLRFESLGPSLESKVIIRNNIIVGRWPFSSTNNNSWNPADADYHNYYTNNNLYWASAQTPALTTRWKEGWSEELGWYGNSRFAVWSDGTRVRGKPNLFTDMGFRGSTPEYNYTTDGITPFFVIKSGVLAEREGFRFGGTHTQDKGKTFDYRLASGSLGINFGDPTYQPEDSLGTIDEDGFIQDDGITRNAYRHSVGAYEFDSEAIELTELSITLTGNGHYTPTPNRTYFETDEDVTIEAQETKYSIFDEWYENDVLLSSRRQITLSMATNRAVEARFSNAVRADTAIAAGNTCLILSTKHRSSL